jgi:hypothetical protein
LKAVIFVDFTPVHVGARALHEDKDASQAFESLGLRPTMSSDIVKFHKVMALMEEYFLRYCDFKLIKVGGSTETAGPAELIDDFSMDDFEDDFDDDEIVWAQRLEPLLADALSAENPRPPAVREEAAQALARMSETGSPDCHVAIMSALVEKEDRMVQLLAPQQKSTAAALAEAYPLAAALKCAALTPEAVAVLASSGLPARLAGARGGEERGLLAREVDQALSAIVEARSQNTCNVGPVLLANPQLTKGQMYAKIDAQNCDSELSTACSTTDMLAERCQAAPKGFFHFESEMSNDTCDRDETIFESNDLIWGRLETAFEEENKEIEQEIHYIRAGFEKHAAIATS